MNGKMKTEQSEAERSGFLQQVDKSNTYNTNEFL